MRDAALGVKGKGRPGGWLHRLFAGRLIKRLSHLGGKFIGVSWKTHDAQGPEICEFEVIVESLKATMASETKGKLRFEGLYNQEKRNHDECAKERNTLRSERDMLVEINRNLGRELHRLRGLFLVTFSSKRAREMALEHREIHVEHLRKLTGGSKFSAKHVARAIAIARQQRL